MLGIQPFSPARFFMDAAHPHSARRLAVRVIAFGFLATFMSSFGQTFFIGLFNPHFEAAIHISDSRLGIYYGLATLTSGSLLFWLGGTMDRFHLRHAVLLTLALFVCGCLLAGSVMNQVALFVAFLLLRLGGQGLMTHLGVVVAARGGGQRKASAIARASMGVILGEAMLPAIVLAVLAAIGWRWLWWGAAGILLLGVLPAMLQLGAGARWRDVAADADTFTIDRRRTLLRQPIFWAGLTLLLAPPFMTTGFLFDQALISRRMHWPPGHVGAAFTIFALCRALATWTYGRAADRFGALPMARLHLLPMALGFGSLAVPLGPASIWVAFAGLGFTNGANSVLGGAVWVELFGESSLGLVRGVFVACMVAATALAPMVMSGLLSLQVSIAVIGMVFAGYCALASALVGPVLLRHHRHHLAP